MLKGCFNVYIINVLYTLKSYLVQSIVKVKRLTAFRIITTQDQCGNILFIESLFTFANI